MKFQITGIENGLFQLEVHGVKFEKLKDKDDPDADNSFDEEEKVVDMSFTGYIQLNDLVILGNSNDSKLTEKKCDKGHDLRYTTVKRSYVKFWDLENALAWCHECNLKMHTANGYFRCDPCWLYDLC